MTPPEEKDGGTNGPEGRSGSTPDSPSEETAEYRLGGEDDVEGATPFDQAEDEHAEEDDAELEDEFAEEELDEELAGEEELEDEDEVEDESELEELISAETQEWDSVDPDAAGDGRPEVEPAPRPAPAPAPAGGGVRPSGPILAGTVERARRWRPGFPLWLRFTTASLLIVASVATATAASLILYLGDIAEALDPGKVLSKSQKYLTTVDGGAPQTILIIGSDKDPERKDIEKGFRGLSDTTMLLRLDPDREAIALFSLPRDLRVNIPGHGIAKLNDAYAYGGPELTLRTVEEVLSQGGSEFEVNHLVNVDFEGFARAVNALDCVYVDVDRRYFNSNEGKPDALAYEEIDLQPGYQALCGFDALDYARYRHTDNDIVRAARQQEFLREARQKIPPQRLFEDRKELIKIFTEHTTSDINNSETMLQVLKLFLESRDAPIKQIKFEGHLGPSFVTTTPSQLEKAVNQFFGFQATPGTAGQTATPDQPVEQERAPDEVPVPASGEGKRKTAPKPGGGDAGLVETQYGKELARSVRARVAKLSIYYPTLLEIGSDYDQKPRVYKINGTGEGSPPPGERSAYKWVFSRPALGEYYGFMGTRWKDPPILEGADETRTIKDREYKLYYDGDRLRMVAWQDDLGSYWLTNTLIETLNNAEMLRIAEGFRKLPRVAEGG